MNTTTTAEISNMTVAQIDRSQAVAVTITFHRIGDKKEGDRSEVKSSADADMTRVVKNLFASSETDANEKAAAKCAEFAAIVSFDGQTANYVKGLSVPLLGRRNIRLLNANSVVQIDAYLTERAKERKVLVDAFCKVYETIIENAKGKLNAQFDESDYPSVEAARAKFGVSWDYLALGVPENLPDSVKAVYAEKAEKTFAAAAAEIRDGLRAGLAQMIDSLIEKLQAKEGDKSSHFRDSAVDNVLQFIDSLTSRNLTNDDALMQVAAKAKELIASAKPEDLRKNSSARKDMIAKMTTVAKLTTDMLTPDVSRKFRFD